MAQTFKLEVVTPDKKVLSTNAHYAGVPGVAGEFGVLSQHIPFLSALGIGELYYKNADKHGRIFISGGFAEVGDNSLSILAEAAEKAEDIDKTRAEKSLERAEKRLQNPQQNIDISRAKLAMARALGRLKCLAN